MNIKADIRLKFEFVNCLMILNFRESNHDNLHYILLDNDNLHILNLIVKMDSEENYHIAILNDDYNKIIEPEYLDNIKQVLNYYNGYEYDGSCEENTFNESCDLPF